MSDRRVSVSDAFVVEGGTLAFEVGFTEGPSGRDVTVRYRPRAGTAAAVHDYDDRYESASQELKIVADVTSATVLVPTVPDPPDEDNERLELVLSDPQGAVIDAGDRQATVDVALVNDDVAEVVETFRLEVSAAVNANRDDSVGVATITDDDGLVQVLVDDPAKSAPAGPPPASPTSNTWHARRSWPLPGRASPVCARATAPSNSQCSSATPAPKRPACATPHSPAMPPAPATTSPPPPR